MQQSQDKIARLEQEKEHWLLEAQLGKVRLEKENQRIADMESQLAAASGGSPNSRPAAASVLSESHEEAERERHAAGRETTPCTSLVQSLWWLLYLVVFACTGHFLPTALVSGLLQQREYYHSFLVAPSLSTVLPPKTSNVQLLQNRITLFEFTLQSQSRAV